MDAGAKEDGEAMEDAVAVAVSADVPDVRDMPHGDKCDDKKCDDNNDEGDGYDDNAWSHEDDVVAGPEYRRQITSKSR